MNLASNRLQVEAKFKMPNPMEDGGVIKVELDATMKSPEGKTWQVDPIFPEVFEAPASAWGIDEGFAQMLVGMVAALQPQLVLETGTNRGRSTRAIAEGLACAGNEGSQVVTVDRTDHKILESGAIYEEIAKYVTPVIGHTPKVFAEDPLDSIQGFDFAFLDGDHSPDGILIELDYLETHRAEQCTVVIDNTIESGWPELKKFFEGYADYPCVNFPTMSGTTIIQMR